MEKVTHKLIDEFTQGVDTYTHNDSTWLIFTETKQWVIELTKTKTLWYNYNFFKTIFAYTSLDVVDSQLYITKWVEDNIINKVSHTNWGPEMNDLFVEDTIQNGVKKTNSTLRRTLLGVDDIIQNGVKETRLEMNITEGEVDDIIQDGVKSTISVSKNLFWQIGDTLQNGVKETIECNWNIPKSVINEVVNDGVKHTEYGDWLDGDERLDDIINNGVRDTQSNPYENKSWIEGVIKKGVKKTLSAVDNAFTFREVEDTIQNGVNETKSARGKYIGDVIDVLENGVRTSHPRQYVDEKMIDKGVIETHDDVYHHKGRIDGVIKNGVKETKEMLDWVCTDRMLSNILENGIKETKTPGKDGDIMSTIEWMEENKSTSYTKMIDDVIENGVKETVAAGYTDPKTSILHIKWGDQIDDVIDNGVKETKPIGKESPNYPRPVIKHIIKNGVKINGTYAGGQRQSEKCKSVVEYGTKNKNP